MPSPYREVLEPVLREERSTGEVAAEPARSPGTVARAAPARPGAPAAELGAAQRARAGPNAFGLALGNLAAMRERLLARAGIAPAAVPAATAAFLALQSAMLTPSVLVAGTVFAAIAGVAAARYRTATELSGPGAERSPVAALWGRRTMSSAESFALMLAQCPQVTTMGDRSAGSSANPRRLEPGCGITVNLPRWRDLDPQGNPIEHVGIVPSVKLDFAPGEFTDGLDPVLKAVLERLRKTPKGERQPGKRSER